MLIAVGIQVTGRQGCIGLHIVAEFDDLDIQAILGRDFFDDFQDLRMRTAGGADLDRFVLRESSADRSGAKAGEKAEASKELH